jgi:hypothetical protein
MKRATLGCLLVMIAMRAVRARSRRRWDKGPAAAAGASPGAAVTGVAADLHADLNVDPLGPLDALAAVEWAASETAMPGTPSPIPAVPSIPALASSHRREPLTS